MAPEQIAVKDVDPRTDVYALGCVLYEMLCGRPPFLDSEDDVQVLYRQVHEQPKSVRARTPNVAATVEAVVMRALQKDPAARWATAKEMAQALEATGVGRRSNPSQLAPTMRIPKAARVPWVIAPLLLAVVAMITALALRQRPDALVLVISHPAGATIELDGRSTGETTPAALRVVAGEHTVRLQHEHHADLTRTIKMTARERQTIDAQLPARSHTIEVQTVPDGATVYLDGMLVAGRTPVMVSVSDDEYHEIRLERDGYETVRHKLKPEETTGAMGRIVLRPESQPRGTLFVDAAAPSEVWIDDQYSGFLTPTPPLHVAPGDHRVELRAASGESVTRQVQVSRGQTLRLSLTMPGTR
jgi:hypothetical protein